MNWLDEVVNSTVEAESPERFQYWAALSAISAVVKKNLYLDRYYYRLYPNTYVFLVGRSGLRKGNPVTFSKKLVQEVANTRVILGRNSIQAVLKELGKAHSVEGGEPVKDAIGYMVSGELASFLVKDPEALTILTDLYDTHANEPEWRNTLKTSGIDVLKNPCLTLLGATNETHFKDAVPANAVGGGFIARTLIVFEQQRRVVNDLLDPPKVIPDIKGLAAYLKEVAKLRGEFIVTAEGRAVYRPWYQKISNTNGKDPTGTLERIGDTTLKTAMLLSLADGLSKEITDRHMEEAIFRTEECYMGMQQVTMGAGSSDDAQATALVLQELLRCSNYMSTRKKMLSKFWGDIDYIKLDRIIETMMRAGVVTVQNAGKDVIYTMKQKAAEAYRKFKVEIN
jgi:hypothetical protein